MQPETPALAMLVQITGSYLPSAFPLPAAYTAPAAPPEDQV
jgi:hypothetical protein